MKQIPQEEKQREQNEKLRKVGCLEVVGVLAYRGQPVAGMIA